MKKIMLVEDDKLMFKMYQRVLTHNGYNAVVSDEGPKALEMAVAENPDLIMLDIMMPKMNGIEVLKQLKNDNRTKNTKVVMLTNLGFDNMITDAFDNGADGYLVKSQVSNDTLIEEIRNYVGE
jgi:CheY-like chemotaxis protein